MVHRWLFKPQWLVSLPILLVLMIAVACGEDATPTPRPTATPAPTVTPVPVPPTATPVPAAPAPTATRAPAPTATLVPTPTPEPLDAAMLLMAPEPNPKYGGVVKVGGFAQSTFYDLHQTSSTANVSVQAPMYDLLVQLDPIGWQELIPDLATSWKISDDQLTYSFSVREGVKFHDGAPLTAEDVVASFTQIAFPLEGVLSPRKSLFDTLKEVVATDAMTVEFRLTEPRGFFLRAIASGFNVIYRKQTLEDNNYDLRRIPDYPGTGPFVHGSLEQGVVWKMERNPNYWNETLPYLDGIDHFHLGTGPPVAVACLANTIDYCQQIDPASDKKVQAHPRITSGRIFPTFLHGVAFNFNAIIDGKTPFADVRVRKAVNLVLDKRTFDAVVDESFPSFAGGWLAPSDPLFKDYWEQVNDQPGWRSPTDDDIAEAKRLMAEAGYADGIKGVDFMVREAVAMWVAMSPVVQDILQRELGIETTLRNVASGPFFEEMERGSWDLVIPGLNASLPHIGDYWTNWFGTGGGYNLGGYSSPEFDAIVSEALGESDPVKFKDLVNQGAAVLQEDVPLSILGSLSTIEAWWDYVKGHQTEQAGTAWWEFWKKSLWWLDK